MLPLIHEYQMTHLRRPKRWVEKCLLKQKLSLQTLVLAVHDGLTDPSQANWEAIQYFERWLSRYKYTYDQLETSREFKCHQCKTQQKEANHQAVSGKMEDMDFTKPWNHSQVAFIVAGQTVYANKTILSMSSPVMKARLESDFKERDANQIELPKQKLKHNLDIVKIADPIFQIKL